MQVVHIFENLTSPRNFSDSTGTIAVVVKAEMTQRSSLSGHKNYFLRAFCKMT